MLVNLPSLSKSDLDALLPPLGHRQEAFEDFWINAIRDQPWHELAGALSNEKDIRSSPDSVFEISPFIRVGRFVLSPENTSDDYLPVADYLTNNLNYPALVYFRDKPACLFLSESGIDRIAQIAQISFINLICNLDPTVVQCTAIDLQNFGATFKMLVSAIPKLELITDKASSDNFFKNIPEKLKLRNQSRPFEFKYLFDFNKIHKDSALPYHFVFIGSYQDDLTLEQQTLLTKLFSAANAAKAGIYFVLLVHSVECATMLKREHASLPCVREVSAPGQDGRIEVIDPSGINTGFNGSHSALTVEPDGESLVLVSALVERCREHLLKRQPERVKLSLPSEGTWEMTAWSGVAATGLSAKIGKAKGSFIEIALGEGEIVHNALIGGAVGTGKTMLLHAIILQMIAKYSPNELHVSILDYKNGTEFSVYDKCPHIYALSLGAATKFGLDLLEHLSRLLRERADLFKSVGASNIEKYREKTGAAMPRHLVVIDEFQILLTDGRRGQRAQGILEDLIRRGRSFGFNFILSSQSLRDGSLTTATKSNIGCRICLRLSESDCSDFLSTNNILPSTFEYAGQAVLNKQEGHKDSNTEFRVAHYDEEEIRGFIELLKLKARPGMRVSPPAPYVFFDDARLLKNSISWTRLDGHLMLGAEEGIPLQMRTCSLDPALGPILVCGAGNAREAFEENLRDEISLVKGRRVIEILRAEMDSFLAGIAGGKTGLEDLDAVVLHVRSRDPMNVAFKNVITNAVREGRCKLIILADMADSFRFLGLDKNQAELLVVLDQRAYGEFFYGTHLSGQTLLAALGLPGEKDPVFMLIPVV